MLKELRKLTMVASLSILLICIAIVVNGKYVDQVQPRSTGLIWNPNATNTPEELAKLDRLYGADKAQGRRSKFIPDYWNSMDKGKIFLDN